MRLTRKDAVTTVSMVGIAAVYVAFLTNTGWPLIGSVRGTAAVILVLGIAGGCALTGVGAQYQATETTAERGLIVIAILSGTVALCAAGYAIVNASALALAILFWSTMALWLEATARHAFTTPAGGRDVHDSSEPFTTSPR